MSFGKARDSKISEIFGAGGTTKNLEDFARAARSSGAIFPRDLSLFGYLRDYSAENIDPGWRIKIFLEFIEWSYLSRRFMASPRLDAGIARPKIS